MEHLERSERCDFAAGGYGGRCKTPIWGSGGFSYLTVSSPWNTLICNGEKLPIKVFDNLYPHVSKEKNHVLMKTAYGRHVMNSKHESKIPSISACLANLNVYH